ncbi:MAG: hypothetical protein AAB483_00835 [Patescibacteria group bacterium]
MSESESERITRERTQPEIAVEHLSPEERTRKLIELQPFKDRAMGHDKASGEFFGRLRDKYDEEIINRCSLFHFALGSTLYSEDLSDSFFDFTGDDSVEKFLREEGREIEKQEQPKTEIWLIDDEAENEKTWRGIIEELAPGVTLKHFTKGEDAIAELQLRMSNGTLPHGIIMDGELKADQKDGAYDLLTFPT